MNKKEYQKPAMQEVRVQHTGMLMTSGDKDVKSLQGGYLDYGGSDEGYSGDVR